MGKKNKQLSIFGFIAAMRTMLENYPELKMNQNLLNLLNSKSPLAFLLNLAELCGLSKKDLLNWVSRILCGTETFIAELNDEMSDKINNSLDKNNKVANGILDVIEESVKVILLANVKNLFTCSLNPLIPNDVLKYPYKKGLPDIGDTKGIVLSIPTIDLFNVLSHSPNSRYGKTLYFDNKMASNDFWKSADFNVFLWYIINKSSNINDEHLKNVWDNRIKFKKTINNNSNIEKEKCYEKYFNPYKGNESYIKLVDTPNETEPNDEYCSNEKTNDKKKSKDNNVFLKKQYILLEYAEQKSTVTVPNTITIWLNADRYRRPVKLKNGVTLYVNKTVFEFNYDYIYSLKLFNSKTIVSNVLNSLLGVINSGAEAIINGKYSLEEQIIAGKVSEIVTNVMQDENTIINDCFFSFSNDEYDDLLKNSEIKFNNNYVFGTVGGKLDQSTNTNIINEINNIENCATLEEQQTTIENLFTGVAFSTAAKNGEVSIKDKFTFGENIIFDIIKECVTQIVLQVLSPKVMVLYALNSYFMGDITETDISKINISNFILGLLKNLTNLITNIVKQIIQILITELLKYLLDELKELLNLILEKLILERLEYYMEIIRRLIALIEMFYNTIKKGAKADSFIDNVNYPDIVPKQNNPTEKTC